MKLFFSYIKLFLVVSLLSIGYFSFKYWQKASIRKDMQKVELTEFDTYFRDDSPMPPNKYVETLGYPSLKARSEELRSLYNRREQAINMVEKRVQLMHSKNLVSSSVEKSVNRNLTQARKINADLLRQIKNIIDFAESQYASDMVRHDSKEDDERARRIAEENENLLKTVEIPQMFK